MPLSAPGKPEVLDPAALPTDAEGFDPCEDGDNPPYAEGDAVASLPVGFMLAGGGTPYFATWIEDTFRKWRVPFRVIGGWETRGRPLKSGPFAPRGVLVHHTGSPSSATNPHGALGVVTRGRPDLPGPLCQVSTGYDGVTTIVAAGRANHAGTMRALGSIPAGDGNAHLIGNEVQTSGLQPMPPAQYDGIVRSTAALLDAMDADVDELGLHATTSTEGKWDLGAGTGKSGTPYSLTQLRNDVAAALAAGPDQSQEDDMPAADIADIKATLGRIENALTAHDKEEDARYASDFAIARDRHADLVRRQAEAARLEADRYASTSKVDADRYAQFAGELDAIAAAIIATEPGQPTNPGQPTGQKATA